MRIMMERDEKDVLVFRKMLTYMRLCERMGVLLETMRYVYENDPHVSQGLKQSIDDALNELEKSRIGHYKNKQVKTTK